MQPIQRWIRRRQRFVRAVMAVSLLFGGSAAVSVVAASPAFAASCGDTLATVNGVAVYSNAQNGKSWGYNNCVPPPNDVSYVGGVNAGYKWQCVEFVNRYYLTEGWTTAHWHGNGNELGLPANLPSSKFTTQANGHITSIVPGDVVTLTNSGAGHAGVVSSVNAATDQVTIANQNIGDTVYKTVTYNAAAHTLDSELSGDTTQYVIHTSDNTATGIGSSGGSGGGGTSSNSVLSAVAMPNGQQMVFWKGGDSNLWAAYYDGTQWHKQNIGSANGFPALHSPPAAVYQPSTNWVQVFWEGAGGRLYQAVLNNGTWVGGWDLNVTTAVDSQPAAAVNGNQVDVFFKEYSGGLGEVVWNGSAWVSFDLGSSFWNIASAPTAFDQSTGENDVWWTDTAGNLCEGVWNGVQWVGFPMPVGQISSQPAADLEPGTNFQDVFWASSGNLQETVWNGVQWNTFPNIPHGTGMATAPTSIAWGTQIDVFWTDSSGNLQEDVWNGAIWVNFTVPGMVRYRQAKPWPPAT